MKILLTPRMVFTSGNSRLIPFFSVAGAAIFFSAVSAGGGRLPDWIESIDP
jgi:hypothetical protein